MILTIIIWILSMMAGSGVYGMIGEDIGYQSGGTGTFGIPNEVLRTLYSLGAGAIPLILKFAFPKYWPALSKILEILKVKKPIVTGDDLDGLLEEFQLHAGKALSVSTKLDCGEAMKKGGDWYTHCLTLFQEHRANCEHDVEPDKK